MFDQEASLSVGLGKLAANRNLVGLRVAPDFALSFLFSSTLAHSSRLELEK